MTHIKRRDFNKQSLACLGAWALSSSSVFAAGQDGLTVHRVFGKEIKTGPYKHPACLTELENGDFYLVYYGGAGEYATATAVFGSRLKKGETAWSEPRVIANDPFRSVGNGVVWQAPDKLVWLFYVVRFGDTWSTSRIQAKVSKDNGETWSDAFILALEEGMMVRNRPIVLNNGNYLLPVYQEKAPDTESVGPDSTSLFLLYDVKRKSWQQTGRIRSAKGNIQPAVVQINDNYLIAYCRRGGDYKPTSDGYLVRAESRDGGRTWSEGRDSQFPNPNAAVDFIKLRSGNLLLVYNDHMYQRTPLTAALSTDLDRSYPFRRNIAEGKDSFAYPIALQSRDDQIHVAFTSQQRTVLNHPVFREQWLRAGRSAKRG